MNEWIVLPYKNGVPMQSTTELPMSKREAVHDAEWRNAKDKSGIKYKAVNLVSMALDKALEQ